MPGARVIPQRSRLLEPGGRTGPAATHYVPPQLLGVSFSLPTAAAVSVAPLEAAVVKVELIESCSIVFSVARRVGFLGWRQL